MTAHDPAALFKEGAAPTRVINGQGWERIIREDYNDFHYLTIARWGERMRIALSPQQLRELAAPLGERPRKMHRAFHLTTKPREYDGSIPQIVVNNGSEVVGLMMRYAHALIGVDATLTSEQARALGEDLIARADELEAAE